jgi:hypothetical protein
VERFFNLDRVIAAIPRAAAGGARDVRNDPLGCHCQIATMLIAGISRSLSWREKPNHWRAITRRVQPVRVGISTAEPAPTAKPTSPGKNGQ